MCQDLNEYDPFEEVWIWDNYEPLVNEPMNDYDWEEWLEVE